MKKILTLLTVFCINLILFVDIGNSALRLRVTPLQAAIDQTVTIRLVVAGETSGIFQSMRITVDFGDGSRQFTDSYGDPQSRNITVTHRFTRSGSFTISAENVSSNSQGPDVIENESQDVTIIDNTVVPPANGTVGVSYQHDLAPNASAQRNRYLIIGGRLAPGLTLATNGTITGIPTQEGRFSFRLQVTSLRGVSFTTNLTVTINPANFIVHPSSGTVGVKYRHDLAPNASAQRNNYSMIGGKLAPGLVLATNGRITGTPTQKGRFSFRVQVTLPNGYRQAANLSINIAPGTLAVDVTPDTFNVTRATVSRQEVNFRVTQPTVALNETIRSSRGEFHINGRVIGYINSSMSMSLNTRQPVGTENITVPASVLQKALAFGERDVRYRRTFTSANLTPGVGEAEVKMRTPARGELRITKMRVYFEQNNRSIILVERNERNLTGAIDIHFNGSGTLKGYWKVGDRVLKRIQKNLFYGKVVTINTPKVPHLPTYSEGGHRLQFIVTEPKPVDEEDDFPEAIYHVEANPTEIVVPLSLISPENGAEIDVAGDIFSWTDSSKVSRYRVEFLEEKSDEPFFKAHKKSPIYNMGVKILNLRFAPEKTYRWRVKGFNDAGELVAESSENLFILQSVKDYVPGEIIFHVDNTSAARAIIPTIVKKYQLQIVEQTELESTNRIFVLCTASDDIEELSAKLQREDGVHGAQPNYIFSTMNESDPLRSLQEIDSILDLDHIHKSSTGKNVVIAVIDTGIDYEHNDLKGRIINHQNFVKGTSYNKEIHGTAVAGVIAGERNSFGILGIAPDTEILALRACKQLKGASSEGECYTSTVAKAIDVAVSEEVDIVNLSIGTGNTDALISSLVSKGSDQGVVFIAPVGNDLQAKTIAFPASHPDVISVAGFGDDNKPLPNLILAQGAKAIAPGRNIFSSTPGDKHNFFEGTSFSAATISGIIALSLEKKSENQSSILPHYKEVNQWQEQVSIYIGIK